MRHLLLAIIAVLIFTKANAQLPESDVWVFSYSVKGGNYSFINGRNASNHVGYDNQPFFSKNSADVFFTSERDSGQTDIYCYSHIGVYTRPVIQTRVSEYSPEIIPGSNFISDVVVEKDSTQRLWKYDLSHRDQVYPGCELLLPEVKNVAYSRWFNDSIVFLCILPEPMNLFVANVNTGKTQICAMNVNRSMCVYHEKKRDLFLYSQMKADSSYAIQALSSTGSHISDFENIPFLKGSQDFTVDNTGNIFMASGTKLFVWTIGKSKEWKEIADFASQGLHKITRLAVSPDGKHFAFVDNTN